MVRALLLSLAGLALAFAPALADGKAVKNDKKDKLPDSIFKTWKHSREEDKDGVKVYRPSDYKFPPARGRAGFEIKKTGEYIAHDIGAADGTDQVKGKWELTGKNKVKVTFADKERKALTFEVVSCDGKVLKVK